MPETADVSVVMPAWRAAGTIGRALASVAAQTISPREVIVVDDGSDDGTADMAEKQAPLLAAAGIALKVLRQPNLGPGAARNRAIHESSGAWLAFLDADDEWLPAKIARSLAVAAETGAEIVSHNFIIVNNGREFLTDSACHCPPGTDPFVPQLLRGFIANTTVLAKRATVITLGGFDPDLRSGQDYDLWLAATADPAVHYRAFPDALTRYHITPGSVSSRIDLRHKAAMTILRRYRMDLRRRGLRAILAAVLRVIVIGLQAAAGYARQGHWLKAAGHVLRIPIGFLELAFCPAPLRRNFLKQSQA